MANRADAKHHEFVAHLMVQGCGFLLQWNAIDIMRDGFLYAVRIFWRFDARWWIQFRWDHREQARATLEYSEGKKYRQVVHWKLCGPLVSFMRDGETPT